MLPEFIHKRLTRGHEVAAELPSPHPEMRMFVMIISQVPSIFKDPLLWLPDDWLQKRLSKERQGEPELKSPSSIRGFEIRYLEHKAKYTNMDWGMDYDYVLDDETTRVKRIFVEREDEIAQAVSRWVTDLSLFREPIEFDSSLVNSPIDFYLDESDEQSHLFRS